MLPAMSFCALLLGAAPREPAGDTAALVEAVRTLAGQQLYQTYQNLETVVELQFYGIRPPGELTRLLRGCVESAEEAEQQLARVAKLKGLGKDDAAAVARLREIARHLREQGNALRAYWETGVADNWKDAEAARKAAWKELADVLDLEGTKGIAPKPREAGKKQP